VGSLDKFVDSMFTMERWPFWAAAIIFAVVGHFTAKRLFTRERAYMKGRFQSFWWWGRESLVVQPLVAGVGLGYIWPDPEGKHWPQVASCMYFAVAGAVGLVLWILIRGYAKKKGVVLTLPGDSGRPGAEDD
jgi:hypothetical protein